MYFGGWYLDRTRCDLWAYDDTFSVYSFDPPSVFKLQSSFEIFTGLLGVDFQSARLIACQKNEGKRSIYPATPNITWKSWCQTQAVYLLGQGDLITRSFTFHVGDASGVACYVTYLPEGVESKRNFVE